ncbi:MAG: 5'-methylthioadenosine phosphorylase [Alphaproteobacteria bacterium]
MAQTIPKTPFALLSGSAGWGLRFPDDLELSGVRVLDRWLGFETPWGPCGQWQVLELAGSLTPDGRARVLLNVFSHGWPDDAIDHAAHRRVAWVLREAGARKVLADSTCGSLNKALAPRDLIVARDVIDFGQTQHSVMAGRLRHQGLARQLFCPSLSATLEATARPDWPAPGRVLGHGHGIVVAHNWGPRFTSRAEARAYQMMGGDAINQSIGPEASAMREIGACFASSSYVVCWEDGIVETEGESIDPIHHALAKAATRISLLTMARADEDAACGCAALRIERAPDYATFVPGAW